MPKKRYSGEDKLQIVTFRDRRMEGEADEKRKLHRDIKPDIHSKRAREDWPDPEKPRFAEVNRLDALFQARISKGTADRVKAFIEASGMQKKDLTEQALNRLLDELEAEFDVKSKKT